MEHGSSGAPEDKGRLIAEAAREVGVADHVLRYWEEEGLISPSRDGIGRRRYSAADLRQAHAVRAAREDDVPLSLIRDFLRGDAEQRARLVEARREELDRRRRRIDASLERLESRLATSADEGCPLGA